MVNEKGEAANKKKHVKRDCRKMLWNFVMWGINEISNFNFDLPDQNEGCLWSGEWKDLQNDPKIQNCKGIFTTFHNPYHIASKLADHIFWCFESFNPETENSFYTQQLPYRNDFTMEAERHDQLHQELQEENSIQLDGKGEETARICWNEGSIQ